MDDMDSSSRLQDKVDSKEEVVVLGIDTEHIGQEIPCPYHQDIPCPCHRDILCPFLQGILCPCRMDNKLRDSIACCCSWCRMHNTSFQLVILVLHY